jgi:hypothetical protein
VAGGAQVIKVGVSEVHRVAIRSHFFEAHELLRLGVRQAAQQHPIDHAKDGGGRTNRQRQGEDHYPGNGRGFGQQAQAVTNVS